MGKLRLRVDHERREASVIPYATQGSNPGLADPRQVCYSPVSLAFGRSLSARQRANGGRPSRGQKPLRLDIAEGSLPYVSVDESLVGQRVRCLSADLSWARGHVVGFNNASRRHTVKFDRVTKRQPEREVEVTLLDHRVDVLIDVSPFPPLDDDDAVDCFVDDLAAVAEAAAFAAAEAAAAAAAEAAKAAAEAAAAAESAAESAVDSIFNSGSGGGSGDDKAAAEETNAAAAGGAEAAGQMEEIAAPAADVEMTSPGAEVPEVRGDAAGDAEMSEAKPEAEAEATPGGEGETKVEAKLEEGEGGEEGAEACGRDGCTLKPWHTGMCLVAGSCPTPEGEAAEGDGRRSSRRAANHEAEAKAKAEAEAAAKVAAAAPPSPELESLADASDARGAGSSGGGVPVIRLLTSRMAASGFRHVLAVPKGSGLAQASEPIKPGEPIEHIATFYSAGKQRSLGPFATAEEAAAAYSRFVRLEFEEEAAASAIEAAAQKARAAKAAAAKAALTADRGAARAAEQAAVEAERARVHAQRYAILQARREGREPPKEAGARPASAAGGGPRRASSGWSSSKSAGGEGEGEGKGVAISGLTFLERLAASRKKKDERHDGGFDDSVVGRRVRGTRIADGATRLGTIVERTPTLTPTLTLTLPSDH